MLGQSAQPDHYDQFSKKEEAELLMLAHQLLAGEIDAPIKPGSPLADHFKYGKDQELQISGPLARAIEKAQFGVHTIIAPEKLEDYSSFSCQDKRSLYNQVVRNPGAVDSQLLCQAVKDLEIISNEHRKIDPEMATNFFRHIFLHPSLELQITTLKVFQENFQNQEWAIELMTSVYIDMTKTGQRSIDRQANHMFAPHYQLQPSPNFYPPEIRQEAVRTIYAINPQADDTFRFWGHNRLLTEQMIIDMAVASKNIPEVADLWFTKTVFDTANINDIFQILGLFDQGKITPELAQAMIYDYTDTDPNNHTKIIELAQSNSKIADLLSSLNLIPTQSQKVSSPNNKEVESVDFFALWENATTDQSANEGFNMSHRPMMASNQCFVTLENRSYILPAKYASPAYEIRAINAVTFGIYNNSKLESVFLRATHEGPQQTSPQIITINEALNEGSFSLGTQFDPDLSSPEFRRRYEDAKFNFPYYQIALGQYGFNLQGLSLAEQVWLCSIIDHPRYGGWQADDENKILMRQELGTMEQLRQFGTSALQAFCMYASTNGQEKAQQDFLDLTVAIEQGVAQKVFDDFGSFSTFAQYFNTIFKDILFEQGHENLLPEINKLIMAKGSWFLTMVMNEVRINPSATYEQIISQVQARVPEVTVDGIKTELVFVIAQGMAHAIGNEKCRAMITTLFGQAKSPVTKKILSFIYDTITPRSNGSLTNEDADTFYSKGKFEHYPHDCMLETDLAVLNKHIPPSEKTLDLGCGTGRLIVAQRKKGHNVHGVDYTERHVEITRQQLENGHELVNQGNWYNLENIDDQEFENVYCIGRNILEAWEPERQQDLFQEANRILKDGGIFIIDIPSPNKGYYKLQRELYESDIKQQRIFNFNSGTIYDGIDKNTLHTRYSFSEEDIESLARSNGFEIIEIIRKPLRSEEGGLYSNGEEAIYFILKKVSEPSICA